METQLTLFQHLVINSFFCIGLHTILQEGYLFEKIGNWLDITFNEWLLKPIFTCPTCMASVWGISYYICFIGFNWYIFAYIISLAGLNTLLSKILYNEN